jgi:ketosteroid isomerase-like protein
LTFALGTNAIAGAVPDPTAPIDTLFAAFNSGSGAEVYAAYAPDAQIVDEFAPFHWTPPSAAKAFWAEFTATNKDEKLTAIHLTHTPFAFLTYDNAKKTAYVVTTTTFHYELDGKPGSETGRWTFVVEKTGTGWLIERSAWSRLT